MTTATAHWSPGQVESLRALAGADARRYARHPLYLLAVGVLLFSLARGIGTQQPTRIGIEETLAPAFLLGVFGFVVAHRLATSLRRTGDLADTAPVTSQRRTAALCVACLVPMVTAAVVVLVLVVTASVWPPTLPGGHVAWFGYEPSSAVWGALIGDVVLAALGGPLLGVAVARWAPFRGSALLGMVALTSVAILAQVVPSPWYAFSPWVIFSDENVVGGEYQTSSLLETVAPLWWCGYAACLCALAGVAALLRDPGHRGRLLATGAVLVSVGVGFVLVAVS
ncbi:MAG: hypothetical protein WB473_00020 [Pedococcus sp.]